MGCGDASQAKNVGHLYHWRRLHDLQGYEIPGRSLPGLEVHLGKSQSQKSAGIPAKKDAVELYYEWWSNVPNIEAVGRMVQYGHTLDITLDWSKWVASAETEVSLALLGKKTAAEACKDAAKAINDVLAGK